MIKADIINQVAEEAAITKVKAVEAVEAVFGAMKAAMRNGERIELRGFGVFQVKPRKKGIGRNPRTGLEVRILRSRVSGDMDHHHHRGESNQRSPQKGFLNGFQFGCSRR